jgi:hypothetical protein
MKFEKISCYQCKPILFPQFHPFSSFNQKAMWSSESSQSVGDKIKCLTDDVGLAVLVADGVHGLSARGDSGLHDVRGDSGVNVGDLVIVKSNV